MEGQYNTRSPAVKRLMREAQELAEPTYDYFAQPLSDNLFEWHFTVRGPADTDYDGGVYHGRIVLPPDYPMKPPNIIVLTPNGRFEIGKKICLSISGHHPESWQPSWSIRTALLAIIGFMPTPSQGTIGSLDYPPEERKKLAKKSGNFACADCGSGGCIVDLLKCKEAGDTEEVSSSTAEEAKEIIKTMSLKGEGEKKTEAAPAPVVEETENEKYKRARKLYSLRMENLIKARLNQSQGNSTIASNTTTSNVQTSRPAAALSPHQGGLDVHPEPEQQPAPVQPRQRHRPQVEPDHQRVQGVQGQDQTAHETRSLFYDIVIAVVIVIIALLIYRRLTLVSEITSTSPPAN